MTPKALEGVRVLELGPYVALPLTGRILGSLGAEVIKLETNKALDDMAFIPAWSKGAGQPDYQRAKKRATLDVRTDRGRELFMELAKISDIFMTNFRRSVLSRWGIDFPQVREVRPDIIVMWQTGLGGNGPYYTYKSYGILVQHMSGVSMLTGSPDSPPGSVNTSYSDYHTGVFQPMAVIGALLRRRATGQPATMESSILKSGAATAGPGILDFQVNQRLPKRFGNRDSAAAPHGVYPCSNPETYCAIAVYTEAEWTGLCRVTGVPDWCSSSEFATPLARLKNRDALDKLLAGWTSDHSAEEVMELMQGAGVPASIVSRGEDLYNSPHLTERGFHQKTRYFLAEKGQLATDWQEEEGIGWKMPVNMSRTPMDFGHYSNIGEDNPYVFGELLGLSQREIQQLSSDGVVI